MSNGGKVTLKDVYELLSQFREEMREGYVSKDEFAPVKKLVYGFTGAILTGFVGVLLYITLGVKLFIH